ncbi:MAG: hypothetical protein JNN07_29205 [Verrucomicrobiales bacterium]|nr:hypothetical protein [Verrucomicrobiales bacterium]
MNIKSPTIRGSGWPSSGVTAAVLCAGSVLMTSVAEAQYGYTGPSTSVEPYYKPSPQATAKGYAVEIRSLLTVADPVYPSVNGYKMLGLPDGLGAFDNGDGTFTVLMNHEIFGGSAAGGQGIVSYSTNALTGAITSVTNGVASGVPRAYGGTGATVSEWVFKKNDLSVVSGQDLIQNVMIWDRTLSAFRPFDVAGDFHLSRFCAGDLPLSTAFYNPATGKGTQTRLYMNGEEFAFGRAFAHIVSGPEKGTSYELPYLGYFSWENSVACPTPQDLTIVMGMDDGGLDNSQMYVYVGTKQSAGLEIEKAGLHNGSLYAVRVEDNGVLVANESNDKALGLTNRVTSARFSLFKLENAANLSIAELESLSISNTTAFFRVEDGNWDPTHPNDFYCVTTGRASGNAVTHASRLWRLRFDDLGNPTAGGTIEVMLEGPVGSNVAGSGAAPVMMDNMDVTRAGKIMIQEDPGGNNRLARVWMFDPQTLDLTDIAQADRKFATTGASRFLTIDEEASGIMDVSHILGEGWFLWDIQMHRGIPGELVEHGQLVAMHVSQLPLNTASTSVEPYYKPSYEAAAAGGYHVTVHSMVTVADPLKPDVAGYKMVGLPDGMGAYDNGNGTFTLLVNHEARGGNLPGGLGTESYVTNNVSLVTTNAQNEVITNLSQVVITNSAAALGITRAYGGKGAFISEWVISKSNLVAVSGSDLIKANGVHVWDRTTYQHRLFDPATDYHFSRFCAGELAAVEAFYNPYTGKGVMDRIFLNGEEDGAPRELGGRAFAHIATGPEKGNSYELPYLGLFAWENAVASPFAQDKTIVMGLDDSELTNSQVYVSIGLKSTTGSLIQKAGLHPAVTYVVRVEDQGSYVPFETNEKAIGSKAWRTKVDFKLHRIGDVSGLSEAEMDFAGLSGGTSFFRVEDGAWDPNRPSDFYFVTTGRASGANVTAASRLWRLCFNDIARPEDGGFIELVLDGPIGTGLANSNEQGVMLDNMTILKDSRILLQEDPGNNDRLAKIWVFDPVLGSLTELAAGDRKFFSTGGSAFLTRDEESSGIIDMEDILGAGWLIFGSQAHARIPGELIEHGQLNAMYLQPVAAYPSLRVSPKSQNITVGTPLVLGGVAQGNGPFSYQWFVNGQAIPGATGSSLTLYNLPLNQSGAVYTVAVTGPDGTVTSNPATVKVNPAGPQLTNPALFMGMVFQGTVGGQYRVEYANSANAASWQSLTNLTLPSSPYLFIDTTASAGAPQRYYRLVIP